MFKKCLLSKTKHKSIVNASIPSVCIFIPIDIIQSSSQISKRNSFHFFNLEIQMRYICLTDLRTYLFDHHLHIRFGRISHYDCRKFLREIWRQRFFSWIIGGIHACNDSKIRVPFNIVQVSFFIEHKTLTLNERNYFLQNIIGCQIDLIQ